MDRISQEAWLERRPYLRPVADFHAQVALAAASIPFTGVHFPSWDNYSSDYGAGVPQLRSSRVSIDFETAAAIVASLVESLTSKPLAEKLAEEARVLDAQLRSDLDAPRRVIAWLLGNDAFATAHPGLLRFFWAGRPCLSTSAHLWKLSAVGATRTDGYVVVVPLADPPLR